MPLIVITGYPSSGKTSICSKLKEQLSKLRQDLSTFIVGETFYGCSKNILYSDSQKEKQSRSDMKAQVERLLTSKDLVILDSLNYIKGYRYELYCLSKSCHTTQCVVHCATTEDTCKLWNDQRPEADKYSDEILSELIQRYEAPKSTCRWDCPLFVVNEGDEPPYDDISLSLFCRNPPKPNQSTVPQPMAATNFLFDLDRLTQVVVNSIMSNQKYVSPGDSISITDSTEKLCVTRPLTLSELQRYRRQFLVYMKQKPIPDGAKVADVFIRYLQGIIV